MRLWGCYLMRMDQLADVRAKEIAQWMLCLGVWTNWLEVFSQFGVVGHNRNAHVQKAWLNFQRVSAAKSCFDVGIKGGDTPIGATGPGPVTTTIVRNLATSIVKLYRVSQT